MKTPPGDRRFSHPLWRESPLDDYVRQVYLINAEYLQQLPETLLGVDPQLKRQWRFLLRQWLDAMAPSNFLATNPELIAAAVASQGESLRRGLQNLLGDLEKGSISLSDDTAFVVGRNLATTPGAVVYENELMQLIEYAPAAVGASIARRPLLIVPPCINKFYILDLQPENSLVRYAVEQGQRVFLLSWRNVQAEQGTLTWDDYIEHGPLSAIRVVQAIGGVERINALGFCVGGTLLTTALAVARARGENPVVALTLLTTLLDFSDTGEIACFASEATVAAREAAIGQGGLLSGRELSRVFSALRANDLIWPYVVANYMKGQSPTAFDLLYWNSDVTNLPGPFLVWYLRNMYLNNSLRVPNKLTVCGEKVDLQRLDMPTFIYASREDHIVPWKTAYQARQILAGPSTFVLGASGHIAGVINPPTKQQRCYWRVEAESAPCGDADAWLGRAVEVRGSWWPAWALWLRAYDDGRTTAVAAVAAVAQLGNATYPPIEPAPGRYVLAKAVAAKV